MCWRTTVVAVGLVAVGLGATAADDAADKELKKLQGTWRVTAAEVDGVRIPLTAFARTTVTIAGNTISFRDGDKVYDEIECRLDAGKDPHEIDYHYVKGLKKGARELGIYTLDGGTLKVCISLTAKKRPTQFDAGKGTSRQLMVLRRERP